MQHTPALHDIFQQFGHILCTLPFAIQRRFVPCDPPPSLPPCDLSCFKRSSMCSIFTGASRSRPQVSCGITGLVYFRKVGFHPADATVFRLDRYSTSDENWPRVVRVLQEKGHRVRFAQNPKMLSNPWNGKNLGICVHHTEIKKLPHPALPTCERQLICLQYSNQAPRPTMCPCTGWYARYGGSRGRRLQGFFRCHREPGSAFYFREGTFREILLWPNNVRVLNLPFCLLSLYMVCVWGGAQAS